jgi:hypothetical protein
MLRGIIAVLAAVVTVTVPVAAETACDMEKATKLIDYYAGAPFSARTWRVLKGLGDPQVDGGNIGDRWSEENDFKEIAAKAAPNVPVPNSIGYECRIQYPLEVLKQRVKDLGEKHPYVEQWVRSQVAIFAACDGDTKAELPPPIKAEGVTATLQQQDRDYQQAVLTFYRDRDKALELFKTISASQSPHRGAARYMVANIHADAKRIAEARAEAKAILGDPSLASVHGITQELVGYIANVEDTAQGWSELLDQTISVIETPASTVMASEKTKVDYVRALVDIDYAGIRAKQDDWWLEGKLPENPTISKAIVDAARKYPIVPWMIAGQTIQEFYGAADWSQIGPKWQDRASSLIDRALALTPGTPPLALDTIAALKARPDEPTVAALIQKAKAAADRARTSCAEAPESAAIGTLTLHAVRTAVMAGRFDDAYALLENYPFKTSFYYRQGTVLAAGRYLLGQGNLSEARRFRDRLITSEFLKGLEGPDTESLRDVFAGYLMWIAEDRDHWNAALALHPRKTELAIMNFLPVKQLRSLAQDDKVFSEAERALFARAAWSRVYAWGKLPEQSFTDELFRLNPKFAAIADKTKTDYPKASPANLRLLTILRTPRYNILVNAPAEWQPLGMTNAGEPVVLDEYDHNDRNWWCQFEPDRHLGALRNEFDADAGGVIEEWMSDEMKAVSDPAIKAKLDQNREITLRQHPVIRQIDWKEIARLSKMPSAPRRLTERAIAWGKASEGDDGAPEALALAVRATRYGCNWHGGHRAYSKPAQELLQKRFKGTTWAAQTPYWFDCMNQKWSDDPNALGKVATCEVQSWPRQRLPK